MLIIGSNVSFGGMQLLAAVKEAINYKANTFMFYTGAPQNSLRVPLDDNLIKEAKVLMQSNNIDINNVICHAPYIVKPATNDPDKQVFAINFLKQEISRCHKLGIKYLVLHPGSSVNETRNEALDNITYVLNQILNNDYDVMILLETMAGKGNECGINLEELKQIIFNVNLQDKIGVCLDTCHLNDSGIDIGNFDNYLIRFDQKIGIKKIKCVHVNDSKNIIGSHKDRHANIGYGTIGFDNLIKVIYNKDLDNIPMILETPYIGKNDLDEKKIYPPYKMEIAMIRNKKFNNNLFEEIRKFYE